MRERGRMNLEDYPKLGWFRVIHMLRNKELFDVGFHNI